MKLKDYLKKKKCDVTVIGLFGDEYTYGYPISTNHDDYGYLECEITEVDEEEHVVKIRG